MEYSKLYIQVSIYAKQIHLYSEWIIKATYHYPLSRHSQIRTPTISRLRYDTVLPRAPGEIQPSATLLP